MAENRVTLDIWNHVRVDMEADLFLSGFAESEQPSHLPSHPTCSITSHPKIPLALSALLSQVSLTGTAKDL